MIVAVSAGNSGKQTTFELQTRISLVEENINLFENVKVESFDGLLVDYVRKGANVLVRGLRVISVLVRVQMAQMNRHVVRSGNHISYANEKYFFTSSQLIKQVHLYGEETGLVPEKSFELSEAFQRTKNPSSFPDEFRRKFTFEERTFGVVFLTIFSLVGFS